MRAGGPRAGGGRCGAAASALSKHAALAADPAHPKKARFRRQVSACWSGYFLMLPVSALPAAGLTFLCFAKEKVSKRKASQRPCPFGYLALLAPPGVGRKLATLKQAPALIRAPLRCSARPMAREPRVLVRCAHLARVGWRAVRLVMGADAPSQSQSPSAAVKAAAAPRPHPFTTTVSFPNLGQQTRIAAPRFTTLI